MSKKRDARRDAAQLHIAHVRSTMIRENMDAVATRKHYRAGSMADAAWPNKRFEKTEIVVKDADSVGAVMEEASPKAVLDFASYHHPGGGYENGAWAQEEALCSESNLYVVLNELYDEFYRPHKSTQNDGLYTSDALYLEDIQFMRDGKQESCDVIVMAAPNAKAARKASRSEAEIEEATRERVRSVLNIARENEVDNLILGAFGCGVFANDPKKVAALFRAWLEENDGAFAKVIFAIPAGANLDAFEEAFAS